MRINFPTRPPKGHVGEKLFLWIWRQNSAKSVTGVTRTGAVFKEQFAAEETCNFHYLRSEVSGSDLKKRL